MVGGWMFLLVPAHQGSPGQRAVKRLLLCIMKSYCLPEKFVSKMHTDDSDTHYSTRLSIGLLPVLITFHPQLWTFCCKATTVGQVHQHIVWLSIVSGWTGADSSSHLRGDGNTVTFVWNIRNCTCRYYESGARLRRRQVLHSCFLPFHLPVSMCVSRDYCQQLWSYVVWNWDKLIIFTVLQINTLCPKKCTSFN